MSIEKNTELVLSFLAEEYEKDDMKKFTGEELQKQLNLYPKELNPVIEILSDQSFLIRHSWMGTRPYSFGQVRISSRGLYEYERRVSLKEAISEIRPVNFESKVYIEDFESLLASFGEIKKKVKPRIPIGSPYGFTDYDWEIVSSRRDNKEALYVVFGSKFESKYYDTEEIRKNVEKLFRLSVDRYNSKKDDQIELMFIVLKAGFGEHLFNQIARDIISSDIAVFETSDQAPNIYLEIGVALTWDSRVLLIKQEKAEEPASDISGQTYEEYSDNGSSLINDQCIQNVYYMIERALWKKT